MLAILSPAKTLDFETPPTVADFSQPAFLKQGQSIIQELKKKTSKDLQKLMSLSPKLAELNIERYRQWKLPFTPKNARPAVFAFMGDVYQGLDVRTLSPKEIKYAQEHVRILSGLYGVLAPLDLIQAYRLEMGTKLKIGHHSDLYTYWKKAVTEHLQATLGQEKILINLASKEYADVVDFKQLKALVITPVFKDKSGGKYKVISFFAKKARGALLRHMLKKAAVTPQELLDFNWEGYAFHAESSTDTEWVFRR